MMKKTLVFTAVLGLFAITSCRKTEPVELPSNGVMSEAHCSNGVMDGDEDGVDCGPTCGPCNLSVADCGGITFPDQTFESTQGTTLDFTQGTVTADTSSGYLVVQGTVGSSTVTATFSSTTPSFFSAYSVTQTSPANLASNEVKLVYNSTSGTYNGYTDLLHLNRINGKVEIEFCDVYFTLPLGGYMLGDGKMTEF